MIELYFLEFHISKVPVVMSINLTNPPKILNIEFSLNNVS